MKPLVHDIYVEVRAPEKFLKTWEKLFVNIKTRLPFNTDCGQIDNRG